MADPWLVLLLPMAAVSGEDLHLAAAADATLVANARRLLEIWSSWYPWVDPVGISVEQTRDSSSTESDRTVSFFSGGVDSFYTLLRREAAARGKNEEPVDELLTVAGFDIPVTNRTASQTLFASAADVASRLGKELVPVETNIRETTWNRRVPWEPLGHGPALVACAHLLTGYCRRALVPAGTGYARMSPRGSHPLTDPLLSSGRLDVVHDGGAASRVQKTEVIATSEVARRHLRVCWRTRAAHNCCACEKCYRTMLTLHLLDSLQKFETFDSNEFSLSGVPRMFLQKESDWLFLREVLELASETGDEQAVRRIRSAFRRSRIKHWLLSILDRLERVPVLGRISRWLRRHIRDRSLL